MTASFHLGLTGYPLGHSLSPQLHRAALDYNKLDGDYRLFPIAPTPVVLSELAELVGKLRTGELHGLNVTIPHKQAVTRLADELSITVQQTGAANTLLLQNGCIQAENTDVPGFLVDLQRLLSPIDKPGKALVLGAGGSARAVTHALAMEGWQMIVAARRLEQALALAAALPERAACAIPLEASALAQLEGVRLVVNATPVGMTPDAGSCPWPAGLPLPGGAAVYDLVYNPPETQLLHLARCAGLAACNGAGMLVEQAALSFKSWTGYPAPRERMREVMDRRLA